MKNPGTIIILSDGTGETAATMIRAALVQYSGYDLSIIRHKNIRTEDQLRPILVEAETKKALLIYTVVSSELRSKLIEVTKLKNIPFIDLMGPLLNSLDNYFGVSNHALQVGILRSVDENYFKRIEAVEYTVRNDDGKNLQELNKADIILVGISRTSKTPLSIFLSHKGWKVANVPLILNNPLPKELKEVDQRKIVGLIIDLESLQKIRKNRLDRLGHAGGGEYANPNYIHFEIEYAHSLFKQNRKWPVLNVTERALEETATEITRIVSARMGLPASALF